MGRAGLLYAVLGSIATNVEPAMLRALAVCGQVDRALGYAALAQDIQQRFDSYLSIAFALIIQQEPERAAIVLEQALSAAESIQDDWDKSQALEEVVRALAQAGQPERAISAAASIRDDWDRALALSNVAVALTQAGQSEQALSIAESIQDTLARALALNNVAVALTQTSRPERGAAILEQVLSTAEGIQAFQGKSLVLSRVAKALAEPGQLLISSDKRS